MVSKMLDRLKEQSCMIITPGSNITSTWSSAFVGVGYCWKVEVKILINDTQWQGREWMNVYDDGWSFTQKRMLERAVEVDAELREYMINKWWKGNNPQGRSYRPVSVSYLDNMEVLWRQDEYGI